MIRPFDRLAKKYIFDLMIKQNKTKHCGGYTPKNRKIAETL
jgi:hypothetical protein